MNYSNMTANGQRLHIAAHGYQHVVKLDTYDVQTAMQMSDIAQDAFRSVDPAKSTLRFAVFLKAVKQAYLQPQHILAWLVREFGEDSIAELARHELGVIKRKHERRQATA